MIIHWAVISAVDSAISVLLNSPTLDAAETFHVRVPDLDKSVKVS